MRSSPLISLTPSFAVVLATRKQLRGGVCSAPPLLDSLGGSQHRICTTRKEHAPQRCLTDRCATWHGGWSQVADSSGASLQPSQTYAEWQSYSSDVCFCQANVALTCIFGNPCSAQPKVVTGGTLSNEWGIFKRARLAHACTAHVLVKALLRLRN